MSRYTWELDFKTFSEKARTIRAPQYCEDYCRLGKRHQTGCYYYLYVDENLNIINPYTKKDEGKKVYKSFVSTTSREDVMKQAHDFIIDHAKEKGLFDI